MRFALTLSMSEAVLGKWVRVVRPAGSEALEQ